MLQSCFYIFIFVGLLNYILNYTHFLISLLRLEFMGVSLFCKVVIFIFMGFGSFYFCIYFLVIGVIEMVIGISFLVMLCYSMGNDYIFSFNISLC